MARPHFTPTRKQRRIVAAAAGAGWRHDDIAVAVGISRSTLERRFRRELERGACRRRLEVLDALHLAAMAGSVSAMKTYLRRAGFWFEPSPVWPPAWTRRG